MNCIGALSFLRSVNTFSLFLKSNWNHDFDHAETVSGAKKKVVLRCDLFCFISDVRQNGVEQKFAVSIRIFFVGMRHFDIDYYFLFAFLLICSKWFPQFIHSLF